MASQTQPTTASRERAALKRVFLDLKTERQCLRAHMKMHRNAFLKIRSKLAEFPAKLKAAREAYNEKITPGP